MEKVENLIEHPHRLQHMVTQMLNSAATLGADYGLRAHPFTVLRPAFLVPRPALLAGLAGSAFHPLADARSRKATLARGRVRPRLWAATEHLVRSRQKKAAGYSRTSSEQA